MALTLRLWRVQQVTSCGVQVDERQMAARSLSATRPWGGADASAPTNTPADSAVAMDIDQPEEGCVP